jgi:hypothetical protein
MSTSSLISAASATVAPYVTLSPYPSADPTIPATGGDSLHEDLNVYYEVRNRSQTPHLVLIALVGKYCLDSRQYGACAFDDSRSRVCLNKPLLERILMFAAASFTPDSREGNQHYPYYGFP